MGTAFAFRVAPGLPAQGLACALTIGVAGGLLPAIRAARLILQESARVESNIFYGRLMVDEGASFDGQSHRCQDPMQLGDRAAKPDAALDGPPLNGSVPLQVVDGATAHSDLRPAQS